MDRVGQARTYSRTHAPGRGAVVVGAAGPLHGQGKEEEGRPQERVHHGAAQAVCAAGGGGGWEAVGGRRGGGGGRSSRRGRLWVGGWSFICQEGTCVRYTGKHVKRQHGLAEQRRAAAAAAVCC